MAASNDAANFFGLLASDSAEASLTLGFKPGVLFAIGLAPLLKSRLANRVGGFEAIAFLGVAECANLLFNLLKGELAGEVFAEAAGPGGADLDPIESNDGLKGSTMTPERSLKSEFPK